MIPVRYLSRQHLLVASVSVPLVAGTLHLTPELHLVLSDRSPSPTAPGFPADKTLGSIRDAALLDCHPTVRCRQRFVSVRVASLRLTRTICRCKSVRVRIRWDGGRRDGNAVASLFFAPCKLQEVSKGRMGPGDWRKSRQYTTRALPWRREAGGQAGETAGDPHTNKGREGIRGERPLPSPPEEKFR